MTLRDRRIWVTAAANGIGRATAELCARNGANVWATDIDGEGLATLGGGIAAERVDATDAVAVRNFAARNGPFDAVIHCVGWVHHGNVETCPLEDWSRSFLVNVDSFYFLLQAVLPAMADRGGSIQCIASIASSIKGFPDRAAYGASKAAMLGLVKSVAADYVALGIRCNAVCPGTILSPSLMSRVDSLARSVGSTNEAMDMFVSRQPMGRLGTPEEVAALSAYLASDESRFVTGQFFTIDGGCSI